MKRTNLFSLLIFAALLLLAGTASLSAQCSFTTNDQIQVALPSSCALQVTTDMALEGPAPNCPPSNLSVQILQNGLWVNALLNASHIGQTLSGRVIDVVGGFSSPFTLLVVDNLPPALVSNCNDVVTVNCEDACSPSLLPVFSDCSAVTLTSTDVSITQPCNSPYSSYVARTYRATDAASNSSSCTRTIQFLRRDGQVVFPSNIILQVSGANCAPWCNNGAGRPNPTPLSVGSGEFGVPTIDGSPIFGGVKTPTTCTTPCVSDKCQQTVTYTDVVTNLCGTNKRINRTWQVSSPCTGVSTYTQQIFLFTDGNTTCGTACNTPTGLNQTFNSVTDQTTLSWSVPASTCVVRYQVRYRAKLLGIVWQPWTTVNKTTTFYKVVLPQGVPAEWQVRTQCNGVYSAWSPVQAFTTGVGLVGGGDERSDAAPEKDVEPAVVSSPLRVFPNPGFDVVTVSLDAPTTNETTLSVTDWQGRVVYQSPLAIGTLSLDLELGNQPAGTYLVRLLQPDGTNTVERFVLVK